MSKLEDVPKPVALALAATGAVATAGKLGWDHLAERREAERRQRAFALHPGEPAQAGVRRLAGAQLGGAAEKLSGSGDPGEAVHSARKSFKRVRSTLRLARYSVKPKLRRQENAAVRELGQKLAGARDGQVMLETFRELGVRAPEFAAHLEQQHARAQQELRAEQQKLGEVAQRLEQAQQRAAQWPLNGGEKRLMDGLEEIYRRGRSDLRAVRSSGDAESLHEWRKRAKDLWYGAEIMQRASRERLGTVAKSAHALSSLLGDHHDLAVLALEAHGHPELFAEGQLQALEATIAERSAELEQRALAAGSELYRRPAKRWRKAL